MICACLGTALWLFCLKAGQVFEIPPVLWNICVCLGIQAALSVGTPQRRLDQQGKSCFVLRGLQMESDL